MKKSRFSETQIIGFLKQHESGLSVKEICKQHGLSPQTFYNWKNKYGGMETSQLKKLRDL